ncbi:hypothetical protein, partial [Escherichia coli]|uniref:hypothetical protein n=1 Tax=Escherichia coli TaxID=562 RepID=UPI001BDBAD34
FNDGLRRGEELDVTFVAIAKAELRTNDDEGAVLTISREHRARGRTDEEGAVGALIDLNGVAFVANDELGAVGAVLDRNALILDIVGSADEVDL